MKPENTQDESNVELSAEETARRDFLKKAGRYALVTPPAVTALLSTSMNSPAVAASGGMTTRPGGSPERDPPQPGSPGGSTARRARPRVCMR